MHIGTQISMVFVKTMISVCTRAIMNSNTIEKYTAQELRVTLSTIAIHIDSY